MQGAPDVSDLIEHDRKIVGPMQRLQSQVYNTGAPSLAFAEIDAATLCSCGCIPRPSSNGLLRK
ncbi:hypothetical protein ACVIQT_006462 [Bradyrhizobium diazoefficiens]